MRLLQLDAQGMISLVARHGSDVPRYAILSHTWGADEDEVTYEEVVKSRGQQRPDYQKKPGYKKLTFCGNQAKCDGYDYFWVDTCSIDKSSSAELSESINSMFQWYQQAGICYAYLSDVTVSKDDPDVEDQIKNSRWFRRGWTLQELLAPSAVRFFNQKGQYLGSKLHLRNLVTSITGITPSALHWTSTPVNYSIATRMSWASHRETKRKEDVAYCLLGILGVHMPLLYGEGENAFRRLQEELIKISDDESIFAHAGNNLLAEHPRKFAKARQIDILRKSKSTPYSITNAGLHIHMRVLPRASNDPSYGELGILNCFDAKDDLSRDNYLALPLNSTTRYNTFRRQGAGIRFVSAKDVVDVEYRDIFIQLKRPPVYRLTLMENWNEAQFTLEPILASSCSKLDPGTGKGIRFYPAPPYRSEVVRYRLQVLSSGLASEIVIFFDLDDDKTGLEINPYQERQEKPTRMENEAAFVAWKYRGGPTSAEVSAGPLRDFLQVAKIRVSVSDINDMKAFVWVLRVELLNE